MTRRLRIPAFPRCWAPGCTGLRQSGATFCPACIARLPVEQTTAMATAWDQHRHAAWRVAATIAHRWLADHPAGAA